MAAITALLPPISRRIVAGEARGCRLVIGGVRIAASGCLLLTLDAGTPLVGVVAAYVVFGRGLG